MKENLIIGTGNGALGDALWITPVFKFFPNATLQMVDDKHCWNLSQVYAGIVKNIKFSKDRIEIPFKKEKVHISRNVLNFFDIKNVAITPFINIYPEEINWAKKFLSEYGDIEKMVVIHAHNSGGKDPNNYFAQAIKPPKEIMQKYADFYFDNGFIPLQFCNKPNHFRFGYDNFEPLENTIKIRGLSIRETAACYFHIKKMISGDTGDPYLMIAAGGKVIKLLGPEIGDYRYHDICYLDQDWENGLTREKYFKFSQWQFAFNFFDFNW